jgi:hypothetical protein
MTVRMDQTVRQFLARVHNTTRACGLTELAHAAGMTRKALQTWQHVYGESLSYFPNTECSAFNLVHLHVFLAKPIGNWESWPYAIRAVPFVQQPTERGLYLHCLVPRAHEDGVRELLRTLQSDGHCSGLQVITTRDGWQGLGSATSRVVWRQQVGSAWDVVEYYPLVIPTMCEMIERRPNIPAIWSAIYDRLGERVWEHLPAGVRPLRHNGKCYVREALRLLNERFLVHQHIVRFAPPGEDRVDLIAIIRAPVSDIVNLLGQDSTAFEVFPINDQEHLVRTNGNLSLLQRVLDASNNIEQYFFVDATRPTPRVRFAYEELFNPTTTEWVFPRERIINAFRGAQ